MSMGWAPQVGMEVTVTQFGRAVITRVTPSGIMVQLTDLNGIEVELGQDLLVPTEANLLGGASAIQDSGEVGQAYRTKAGTTAPASLNGNAGFRKSVEALRFGLVPDSGLQALTVGIEELSAWSRLRFPNAHDDKPLASAITGPFGTGKSHTMAVIRRLARHAGYVVARVEVDGQAISLSAPAKLLHQLWSSTMVGDHRSSTPLLDLYLKAIGSGRPAPSIAPRGIDRIQHNYKVVAALRRAGQVDKLGGLMEALLSSSDEFVAADVTRALRAERHAAYWDCRPKPMIGPRIADRPYDFVEVLAGHAVVAKLGGFKGLVVTVDEFEVEQVLSRSQYERVNDLLQILTEYFTGKLDYEAAPLALFFATVGDDGHEGDEAITAMLAGSTDAHHQLEPWSPPQRVELAERIHGVYCDAYGLNAVFEADLADDVERQLQVYGDGDSGLVRAFIKRYVAFLDVANGPPAA